MTKIHTKTRMKIKVFDHYPSNCRIYWFICSNNIFALHVRFLTQYIQPHQLFFSVDAWLIEHEYDNMSWLKETSDLIDLLSSYGGCTKNGHQYWGAFLQDVTSPRTGLSLYNFHFDPLCYVFRRVCHKFGYIRRLGILCRGKLHSLKVYCWLFFLRLHNISCLTHWW